MAGQGRRRSLPARLVPRPRHRTHLYQPGLRHRAAQHVQPNAEWGATHRPHSRTVPGQLLFPPGAATSQCVRQSRGPRHHPGGTGGRTRRLPVQLRGHRVRRARGRGRGEREQLL